MWLVDVPAEEYRDLPLVMKRIEECRQARLKGAADRQKLAATPHLFRETLNPKSSIIIPRVSSENRFYIPIDFLDDKFIVTDSALLIPNAEWYHFGILTSSVHMAWTRTVCGRLKSDYRYSKEIVYNNFPWCNPSYAQKKAIEETALDILIVRKAFKNRSLADLYDQYKMPDKLRKAHQANDRAVMNAYGFNESMTESEIVAALMKMYQKLTSTK